MKMSWPYIAGFFDGEGCMHAVGGGHMSGNRTLVRFKITISQTKNVGRDTLEEIAEFLRERNINAYVMKHRIAKHKIKPHWHQCWDLMVGRMESIRLFVEGVFPYLRIKKSKAEDYRRMLILYPSMIGCTVPARISRPRFVQMVEDGVGYGEIARRYGINHAGVVARAKRLGLHVDTITESNMKRAKVTLEDLKSDYAELGTYSAVARKRGISSATAWERLSNAGTPRRKVVTLEQLQADYAELGTTVAVAEKHGLSQATVWQRLKDAGSLRTRKQVAN